MYFDNEGRPKPKKSEWISVEERLPRKYKTVLVMFFDVDPRTAVFSTSYKIWAFRNWRGLWILSKKNLIGRKIDPPLSSFFPYCWQPLPEPPR